MNKKTIINYCKELGTLKKGKQPYDFQFETSSIYDLKLLKVTPQTQITFNSPRVIEVAKGKKDGIRFKKTQSTLHRFSSIENNNVIIVIGKPYRILKYINENEVIDISNENQAHGFHIITSTDELQSILK